MTRTPQSGWTPAEIAERDSDLRPEREPLSEDEAYDIRRQREESASGMALAMDKAPTIKDAIMRLMVDHYWDSLNPQKELIIKHIEGALRHLPAPQPADKGDQG